MSINYLHMTMPSAGLAPINDGDAANVLMISIKHGSLPPRASTEEAALRQASGLITAGAEQGQASLNTQPEGLNGEMRAAINIAWLHCSPSHLQMFDDKVANGASIATLLLLANGTQPGSTDGP